MIYTTWPKDCLLRDATDSPTTTESLDVETNIGAFIQQVARMAPKLRRIKVWPSYNGPEPKVASPHFDSLVSRLFQMVKHIEYDVFFDLFIPMALQLDKIGGLVHFKGHSGGNCDHFMELVKQNSTSLESGQRSIVTLP
ncbi:hypothetical protein H4218_005486 [Coemansia sp. IMI 209128]|nr:hypothetical protein H4218_005486 [Coemansia sp. IMI 209128]